MAVRVLKVDPAPAVVMIDFAHFAARRIGPVRQPALANASEDLVKLAFADEEREWISSFLSMKSRLTPFIVITTSKGPHLTGAGSPRISARNLAEALLSRAQMIVWLNSTAIPASVPTAPAAGKINIGSVRLERLQGHLGRLFRMPGRCQ